MAGLSLGCVDPGAGVRESPALSLCAGWEGLPHSSPGGFLFIFF